VATISLKQENELGEDGHKLNHVNEFLVHGNNIYFFFSACHVQDSMLSFKNIFFSKMLPNECILMLISDKISDHYVSSSYFINFLLELYIDHNLPCSDISTSVN